MERAALASMIKMRLQIVSLAERAVPRSIVGWFAVCWAAFLLASILVGGLLLSLYRQSTTEKVRHASAAIAHGCGAIAARYQTFAPEIGRGQLDLRSPSIKERLKAAMQAALRDLDGVEGGIWLTGGGSLAYAFPTYEGTGEKTDVPPAEEASIREAAESASRDNATFDRRQDGRTQTLLLHACPLAGAVPQLSAWTMTRIATVGGQAYAEAMAGLGVLLLVMLGSAAWLGRVLTGWSHRLRRLETALATSADELPKLEPTGQQDLDRIVDAVNRAGTRLAEARATADTLTREIAESKRLASLGRIVAGVAHEIRNPIAAMRLKAENAVAAGPDVSRKDRALQAIIEQIERLEALLQSLLSSVQRGSTRPVLVEDVAAFLRERAELFREQAAAHGLMLEVSGCHGEAVFELKRIAQAIDNLTINAIQNTPAGGRVTLRAERSNDRLVFSVADTGHGVPEAVRDQLFEPFVTGRPEGTGLGLAIVREIAEAHGGIARAIHRHDGTTFVVELPWRAS
jgi:signal transduction histidine kinase